MPSTMARMMKRRFPREGVRAPAFWLMGCSLRNLLGMFSEDQTASISTDGPKLWRFGGEPSLSVATHCVCHCLEDTVQAVDFASHQREAADSCQGNKADNEAVFDESLAIFPMEEVVSDSAEYGHS